MPFIGSKDRKEVALLITTSRRAFAGWMDLSDIGQGGTTVRNVRNMRNARIWGTSEGVSELATKGPGEGSKLDAPCDALLVTDVCVLRPLTPEAIRAWGI